MPLHVEVKINDKVLHNLTIGRWSGGTDKDDMNLYIIFEDQAGIESGDFFDHRYGDGALECVRRGLEVFSG